MNERMGGNTTQIEQASVVALSAKTCSSTFDFSGLAVRDWLRGRETTET
jgi:hypothetical protein